MSEAASEDPVLSARRALLLFLLILFLRVAIAAQFRGNYDSQSFLFAGHAASRGENVYAATSRYNYSPLWSYVLALLWTVAAPSTSLFILLAGLLQIAIDAGSAALVLRIARRRVGFSEESSRHAALLFFANPVSVVVSGAQGQFDGASVLCLLAAVYWAMEPSFERRPGRVVGMLTLSILVKHVTAFHPLLFWKRVREPGLSDGAAAIPYAVFFLSFLPFASAWRAILQNVFLYSSGIERGRARPGGLQAYFDFPAAARIAFTVLCLAAVLWVIRATREMELPRACLVLFLALLVFLPSYSAQYLVWPVALGSLYASPALGVFSTAAALWHSSESLELPWPVRIAPQGAWLAALLWFVLEARRIPPRRERARVRGGY